MLLFCRSNFFSLQPKSAFGAEMGDVAALLRSCGEKSLVFVDEIGRGTSPRDGTSLAGAILETMSESGMSGMVSSFFRFSIHLLIFRLHIAEYFQNFSLSFF